MSFYRFDGGVTPSYTLVQIDEDTVLLTFKEDTYWEHNEEKVFLLLPSSHPLGEMSIQGRKIFSVLPKKEGWRVVIVEFHQIGPRLDNGVLEWLLDGLLAEMAFNGTPLTGLSKVNS